MRTVFNGGSLRRTAISAIVKITPTKRIDDSHSAT